MRFHFPWAVRHPLGLRIVRKVGFIKECCQIGRSCHGYFMEGKGPTLKTGHHSKPIWTDLNQRQRPPTGSKE